MAAKPLERLTDCLARGATARDQDLGGTDLRGAHLPGLRADGLDLTEVDLRQAALAGARWRNCTLRDARIDGADLTDAVLRLCDLDGVRATGALLARARVENCSARGARLDGTDLSGAVLSDSDLSRASLRDANLQGCSASGADLRGADLSGARLCGAVLQDADLRGADLTGADLTGADLTGADLAGATGLPEAADQGPEGPAGVPPGLQDLARTLSPIVIEVLHSARARGLMEGATGAALLEAAGRLPAPPPGMAPSPETLKAVHRALAGLGDQAIPLLAQALRTPNGDGPPPQVQALFLRLRDELGLPGSADAQAVLDRLTTTLGPPRG